MTIVEHPRDVFLAACAQLGASLSSLGFEPLAKAQELRRRRGGVVESIWFQSSYRNAAGQFVAMWPIANVRSQALKKWRVAVRSGSRQDDWVAGSSVEEIADVEFGDWDLADPATRPAVLASVLHAISSEVVPWFELIEDGQKLLHTAMQQDVVGFQIHEVAEYAVFLGHPDLATSIIKAWLARRADVDSTGFVVQSHFWGYIRELRAIVQDHGLDVALPAPDPKRLTEMDDWLRRTAGGAIDIT